MAIQKIGSRIKQALEEKHISQGDVAKKLKKTRQQITNWVTDRNNPPLDMLCELIKMTGKDANWFLKCPPMNSGNQQFVGDNSSNINQTYYGGSDMEAVKQDVALLKQAVLDLQRRLKK